MKAKRPKNFSLRYRWEFAIIFASVISIRPYSDSAAASILRSRLSIAVDALGAENVTGVSMPSQYSSRGSVDDARMLARNLGIKLLADPNAETPSKFSNPVQRNF